MKSLDDLVHSTPAWAGCWRARQALKYAAVAVRLMGRSEDEAALRFCSPPPVTIPARPERCFSPTKGFAPENPPFPRRRWLSLLICWGWAGMIG
ncbi:protein of unknown function (plasmid) [Shinella sp. WSC3-e]|uniref:DUF1403 family protein n=1 Tax=Shinella sp. WSC3-e TaxID=3113208 RepID=UPI00309285B5|nr:protein of unknown function [Shinella sp. WSC3-e]